MAPFNTSQRTVRRDKRPIAANAVAEKGAVAVSKAGFITTPTGAVDEVVVGRFFESVNNTGGADGAMLVNIDFLRERTLLLVGNDATNPVTVAMRETPVTILTDRKARTLVTNAKQNAIAYDVTSEGVWIEVKS